MPFLLTIVAGSATMIGTLPIIKYFNNYKKLINISLSFASGVMISASFFDLIPESLNYFNKEFYLIPSIIYVAIFFSMGIILSTLINKNINEENNLKKVGISSMIAIIIHNLPEGIITYLSASVDIKLGISLAIAIILHNVPEGISIAVPIYYSTKSKKKAFFYTLIAALSEPLGAILAFLFLRNYVTNFFLGAILGIISGIMINISMYELLPEALTYKNKLITIFYTLFGIIFMFISIKFINI